MADLINLRRERKRRDRAAEASQAAANRAVSGVGKSQKRRAAAAESLRERRLSGHHIDAAASARDD